MVMHARKPLKRISDGYFEKHQAHPYQKYSKSDRRGAPGDYGSSDSRYTPLRSPNGNVSHGHVGHGMHPSQSSHGHHHYSHMVDDRGYSSSRNSYLPKGSEKERDRDYKSSRTKYSESVRSPKERSKDVERERSNHERNDSQGDKRNRSSGMSVNVSRSSKYDKKNTAVVSMPPGSEWSEHLSSLGKRYYYNCITEISQWERPRDYESRRNAPKDSSYSSRSNRVKRSRSRSGRRDAIKSSSKRSGNASERYWNNRDNRDNRDDEGHERPRPKHSGGAHEGKGFRLQKHLPYIVGKGNFQDGQLLQDMDISPDRSTPLSENSYGMREAAALVRAHQDSSGVPPIVLLDSTHHTTGSLLAAAMPRVGTPLPGPSNNGGATPALPEGDETPTRDAGPPTPTHSENTDPHAPPLHLEQQLPRKMESLGSYSSVVGGALHPAVPMLTPSLQNYVRSDLTGHVTAWPADILEKQANKFTEEAYQLGCLQCTRVSAELKCSRSVVRHTEIQATLQEQKIMYLRQQISRLEELKSQNSFMSEE